MGAAPGQGPLTAFTPLAQTATPSFQSRRSLAWLRRPSALWATPAMSGRSLTAMAQQLWVWVTAITLAGDPSGGGSSSPLLPLHPLLLGAGS